MAYEYCPNCGGEVQAPTLTECVLEESECPGCAQKYQNVSWRYRTELAEYLVDLIERVRLLEEK